MIRICFVCHGNICRSPMAEFIMKDKIQKLNLQYKFYIDSKATSSEELGNDIHPGTKKLLDKNNISYTEHYASKLQKEDYDNYDYFICMDDNNIRNLSYIFDDPNNKIYKLLDKNIADPWYTGNFNETYNDIIKGIENLINYLKNR